MLEKLDPMITDPTHANWCVANIRLNNQDQ